MQNKNRTFCGSHNVNEKKIKLERTEWTLNKIHISSALASIADIYAMTCEEFWTRMKLEVLYWMVLVYRQIGFEKMARLAKFSVPQKCQMAWQYQDLNHKIHVSLRISEEFIAEWLGCSPGKSLKIKVTSIKLIFVE